jgi:hypothetical protein
MYLRRLEAPLASAIHHADAPGLSRFCVAAQLLKQTERG